MRGLVWGSAGLSRGEEGCPGRGVAKVPGMLGFLVELAKAGGAIARAHFAGVPQRDVARKGARDYVSHVDRSVEDAIVRRIRARFPDHRILGEESTRDAAQPHETLWIIDPIDGTTNFLHGIPHYAVSIALRERGVLRFGCVYDPARDECFTAEAGAGLWLNAERRYGSSRRELDQAVLATALPFRYPQAMAETLAVFGAVQLACDDQRRSGSASLDLAWTAVGRLDGYYEVGIHPWDVAAGEVLVRAGGGVAGDLRGGDGDILARRGELAAATPELHAALLRRLAPLAQLTDRIAAADITPAP